MVRLLLKMVKIALKPPKKVLKLLVNQSQPVKEEREAKVVNSHNLSQERTEYHLFLWFDERKTNQNCFSKFRINI